MSRAVLLAAGAGRPRRARGVGAARRRRRQRRCGACWRRWTGRAATGAPRARPSAAGWSRCCAAALLAAGWLLAGPLAGLALAAAGPAVVAQGSCGRAGGAGGRACSTARPRSPARSRTRSSGGHSVRGAVAEAAARGGVPGAAGDELRRVAHALALGEPHRGRPRGAARPGPSARPTTRSSRRSSCSATRAATSRGCCASSRPRSRRPCAPSATRAPSPRRRASPARSSPRCRSGAAALAELAQPGFLAGLAAFPPSAALLAAAVVLQLAGLLAVRRLARVRAVTPRRAARAARGPARRGRARGSRRRVGAAPRRHRRCAAPRGHGSPRGRSRCSPASAGAWACAGARARTSARGSPPPGAPFGLTAADVVALKGAGAAVGAVLGLPLAAAAPGRLGPRRLRRRRRGRVPRSRRVAAPPRASSARSG